VVTPSRAWRRCSTIACAWLCRARSQGEDVAGDVEDHASDEALIADSGYPIAGNADVGDPVRTGLRVDDAAPDRGRYRAWPLGSSSWERHHGNNAMKTMRMPASHHV